MGIMLTEKEKNMESGGSALPSVCQCESAYDPDIKDRQKRSAPELCAQSCEQAAQVKEQTVCISQVTAEIYDPEKEQTFSSEDHIE